MRYLSSLFTKEGLIFLLLAFPGRILAISCHEFAHAWVANRCGDPTARNLGRLTINPFKHLDPIGAAMMILIGFGWAKPVPVNPRNYRNYRKDDLKVSLAGILMNLILFVLGYVVLCLIVFFTLKGLPHFENALIAQGTCVTDYMGSQVLIMSDNTYITIREIWSYLSSPTIANVLIAPVYGRVAGYIYTMLVYFVQVNIVLAVFNLIPMPPLDGYHVLNDTLLKRPLFANPRTARTAMIIMMALVFSGVVGVGLSYVINVIYSGLGSVVALVIGAV